MFIRRSPVDRTGTDRRGLFGVAGSLALMMLCSAAPSRAETSYTVEVFTGGAINFPTRSTIQQQGEPDIGFTARYETRPFSSPPYYAYRIGFHQGAGAWEIQVIHHKIYLTNNPPEVQHFEITHGYNMVTLNRSWSSLPVTVRVGGGVVVAHTESTVRAKSYSEGYHLTGPVFFAGAGKSIPLSSWCFVNVEALLSYGRAKVPVADGTATAPNLALQGLFGIGFRL